MATAIQQTNNASTLTASSAPQSIMEQAGFKVDAVIDTQIMTAKAFPRNVKRCMEEIMAVVEMNERIAASCYYVMPRAGAKIEGPSIRLAEICSSFWGNLQAGTRFISNDGKRVVVEGWCWDLENNMKVSSEVSKSIINKEKKQYTAECTYSIRSKYSKNVPICKRANASF